MDNFQVAVYNPAGIAAWQLRNRQIRIDPNIIYRDPLLVSTELCTWEDERPAFEPLNFSDYAIGASRIIAMGYRFMVDKVTSEELDKLNKGLQQYTIVKCTAPGTGKR